MVKVEYIKAANNFYRWLLEVEDSSFIGEVWDSTRLEELEREWDTAKVSSKILHMGVKELFMLRLSPADRTKLFRWVMDNVNLFNIGIELEETA